MRLSPTSVWKEKTRESRRTCVGLDRPPYTEHVLLKRGKKVKEKRTAREIISGVNSGLYRLYWFPAVACMLGTVLGFVSFLGWPIELASHFRVLYVAILGIFLLALMATRRRRFALVTSLFIAVNMFEIMPLLLAHQAVASTPQASTFRLMFGNVCGKNNLRSVPFVESVKEENPDVLCVVECPPAWVKALDEKLPEYKYRRNLLQDDAYGCALYSKFPLGEKKIADLGGEKELGESAPALICEFDKNGKKATIVMTHVYTPTFPDGLAARTVQMETLKSIVQGIDGPVIVAADLNCTSWSSYFKQFIDSTGLRDTRQGFGIQASWASTNPIIGLPLDHILTSRDIETLSRHVGRDVKSDHYPVVSDLKL